MSKPHEPMLFIDRDAWTRAPGEALTAQGIEFIAFRDRFAPDAADTECEAEAGTGRDVRRAPQFERMS